MFFPSHSFLETHHNSHKTESQILKFWFFFTWKKTGKDANARFLTLFTSKNTKIQNLRSTVSLALTRAFPIRPEILKNNGSSISSFRLLPLIGIFMRNKKFLHDQVENSRAILLQLTIKYHRSLGWSSELGPIRTVWKMVDIVRFKQKFSSSRIFRRSLFEFFSLKNHDLDSRRWSSCSDVQRNKSHFKVR